ncbi:MAG: hypothetical protein FWE36_05150 [Erysipelotrichales bacterium]|nr:hypothetical protein [Erysipelotrichales bacterium]
MKITKYLTLLFIICAFALIKIPCENLAMDASSNNVNGWQEITFNLRESEWHDLDILSINFDGFHFEVNQLIRFHFTENLPDNTGILTAGGGDGISSWGGYWSCNVSNLWMDAMFTRGSNWFEFQIDEAWRNILNWPEENMLEVINSIGLVYLADPIWETVDIIVESYAAVTSLNDSIDHVVFDREIDIAFQRLRITWDTTDNDFWFATPQHIFTFSRIFNPDFSFRVAYPDVGMWNIFMSRYMDDAYFWIDESLLIVEIETQDHEEIFLRSAGVLKVEITQSPIFEVPGPSITGPNRHITEIGDLLTEDDIISALTFSEYVVVTLEGFEVYYEAVLNGDLGTFIIVLTARGVFGNETTMNIAIEIVETLDNGGDDYYDDDGFSFRELWNNASAVEITLAILILAIFKLWLCKKIWRRKRK